ncbi:hypothetical protein LY78DRAFT_676787 [Colletotrichum sublineola]|uniref:Putative NADH oxidase n=1 Tax=Colletotrichum sublineola TaxID=1173701 RepID=A0A066XZZ6_COLSU|nr:hypothetical protein LY78DRAFT_676787 [Colletotrichum sublineola]KDN71366.1 putative NADH oxidase [Colletotrichum sublineola]
MPTSAPLAQPLSFPLSTILAQNRLVKSSLTECVCTWNAADVTKRGVPIEEPATLYHNWSTCGIRSVGAMLDILQAELGGTGLGRPFCTDPRLPSDMFDNGFRSCIQSWFDEQNSGLGAALAEA